MHHFFVPREQFIGNEIVIQGGDVNHIQNVLRMSLYDELWVNDGKGKEYVCQIERFEKDRIIVKILEENEIQVELPTKIYLFQGLPKQDKMDFIIQKAVELGVYEVIPVSTRRTIVKLDSKKEAKKIERWNSISESAAKQAGRGIIPLVKNIMTFKEAVKYAMLLDGNIIPYESAENMQETRAIIQNMLGVSSMGIFIGPEGGFDREEIQQAMQAKIKPITLGRRILRTETAGMAALSILMFHMEN